jgi:tetratricopeptide (TPR) repeat protein
VPLQKFIARQRLADLLMKMGRFDQAATELDQARFLLSSGMGEGGDVVAKELLEFWVCELNWTLAVHAQRMGNLSQAHQKIEEAVREMEITSKELPHLFWPKPTLAAYKLTQAEIYFLSGQMDEALAAAERSIDLYSQDVPTDRYEAALAHWMLGELLYELGKTSEAEVHFAHAADGLNEMFAALPNEPHTGERIVCFLSDCASNRFRDPPRAVQIAERLLTETNGPMWLYLGLARYRAGDFQGAEVALDKAIDLRSGGDALDWLLLAVVQHKSGRHDEAADSFAKAQELLRARASIYYGWIGALGYQRIRAEVESLLAAANS